MKNIFISYSRKDIDFVQKLSIDLENVGLKTWWDITGIQGSELWEEEIEKGLNNADFYIIVLTPDAIDSRWVKREYISADIKGIPIIPLLLKPCEIPLTLRDIQPIDFVNDYFSNSFLKVLNLLGFYEFGGISFIKIPKGKFLMGSKETNKLANKNEMPQHEVDIPYDYFIGRYPVTNKLYGQISNNNFTIPEGKDDHPIVKVSHDDSVTFCRLLNKKLQEEALLLDTMVVRLPTEAEWEKAARWHPPSRKKINIIEKTQEEQVFEWAWGDSSPDPTLCNFNMNIGDTTPVGRYSPQGDSRYGLADMNGNAWEWTHTMGGYSYPYRIDDGRENEGKWTNRVLRGGSFFNKQKDIRSATRISRAPWEKFAPLYTFRLCIGPFLL